MVVHKKAVFVEKLACRSVFVHRSGYFVDKRLLKPVFVHINGVFVEKVRASAEKCQE